MKNKTASRLFFIFISYFILAILLGAVTAFLSQAGSSLFGGAVNLIFSNKIAFYTNKVFQPGISFALACSLICIGQFYLTDFLNEILQDKVMTFAAMCMASFFCSNAFCRYTDSSIFVLYSMRWLPCEICAFIAGISALRVTGPILQIPSTETGENISEEAGDQTENITTVGNRCSCEKTDENTEKEKADNKD